MKKLLVASVFTDFHKSEFWYKLQIDYLKNTTEDFDHCVFLNGENDSFYLNSKIIGMNNDKNNQTHLFGLNKILEYFKKQINNYEYFLILDSDCFPFKSGWFETLKSNNFDVSACVRFENLDSFAHPAIVFFKNSYINNIEFSLDSMTNLIGENFEELHLKCDRFFPLIRTNMINYHPIMFGVYYDCFYHHGAGSRSLIFRSINGPNGNLEGSYYKFNINTDTIEKKIYRKLGEGPDFILKKLSDGNFVKYL